jgi:hypothetical protein
VAEALGCKPEEGGGGNPLWLCACRKGERVFPHGTELSDGYVASAVARYDTDWAATGPLIEKYRLFVGRYADWSHDGRWYAMQTVAGYPESMPGKDERLERTGTTPLEAVCHLILALKAAGKLEAAS